MKFTTRIAPLAPIAAVALALILSGCDNDNEYRGGRTYLRAGKKVSSNISGWVAIPGAEPKLTEDKTTHISYAVLGTHQVIPGSMHNWKAVPAKLFKIISKIPVEAPPEDNSELHVLYRGEHVPYDMSNWIAVPNTQPEYETSATQKGRGVAILRNDNIVPKEMNGWVATDVDTFARLVEEASKK
jgi:hypothetical protein